MTTSLLKLCVGEGDQFQAPVDPLKTDSATYARIGETKP